MERLNQPNKKGRVFPVLCFLGALKLSRSLSESSFGFVARYREEREGGEGIADNAGVCVDVLFEQFCHDVANDLCLQMETTTRR